MAYQLKTGILPNAITVLQSRAQSAEGRAHVAGLKRSHPEIAVEEADGAGTEVLAAALNKQIEANETAIASLPLTEVGAAAKHDLMAIIISGDGGWRDIDRKVAGFLAEDGVPTIGLDALRYFWSERTPEETARDLERIMDSYGPSFGAGKVVLAGYSFGANVLTLAYARLRPEYQERVTLVSLIAPSVKADFEIAVTGWLGADGAGKAGSVADHVRATHSAKVQCIYGLAEKESACMALSGSSVEVIGLPGGHHFDGDYRDLTVQVFRSAIRRTKAESSAESD